MRSLQWLSTEVTLDHKVDASQDTVAILAVSSKEKENIGTVSQSSKFAYLKIALL
jgi:hypothetical protein